MSESSVTTSDGTKLHVLTWEPKSGTATAQILLVHGYLEHCARYAEFAEYLCEKGNLKVVAYDCRGHGKSSGRRAYITDFAQYHDDLWSVLKTMDKKELPVFLFGHSNGGLICLDYVSQKMPDIRGLLITSPFLKEANEIPYYKVLASKVLGRCLPWLTVSAEEVTAEVLTQDEDKRKEHDEDDLNQDYATVGWAVEVMRAQHRVLEGTTSLSVPLFFCYAGKDMVANPVTNKEFSAKITSDKTVIERKDDYHEVLNETNRKEVFDEISTWILDRSK